MTAPEKIARKLDAERVVPRYTGVDSPSPGWSRHPRKIGSDKRLSIWIVKAIGPGVKTFLAKKFGLLQTVFQQRHARPSLRGVVLFGERREKAWIGRKKEAGDPRRSPATQKVQERWPSKTFAAIEAAKALAGETAEADGREAASHEPKAASKPRNTAKAATKRTWEAAKAAKAATKRTREAAKTAKATTKRAGKAPAKPTWETTETATERARETTPKAASKAASKAAPKRAREATANARSAATGRDQEHEPGLLQRGLHHLIG